MSGISNRPCGEKETIIERRLKALELRKDGNSFRKIGKELGVSQTTASRYVGYCLKEIIDKTTIATEQLRTLELERIDMAMVSIAPKVREGNLFAIDRWIKLSERRSKLTGIDAPEKIEHSGPEGRPIPLELSSAIERIYGDDSNVASTEQTQDGV